MLERDYLFGGINSLWNCVVYAYANRNATDFWSRKEELAYVRSLCTIIENPGKRVTENLYMAKPKLLHNSYKYVFILLDDCKLIGDGTFDLRKMLRIMELNQLTVASPMVSCELFNIFAFGHS
jgi:hypothetical protein